MSVDSKMTAIADAIRAKAGITGALTLDGMAAAVQSIESGGGFPNGTEWTQSNITTNNFYTVANANRIWVAGAYFKKGLYYSTDGKTWTQSNITASSFNTVANANGIWVAGSNNNEGLYYSTDGKTWAQSNITTGSFYAVANANGIWVAGSFTNKGLYYSVSWEPSR